MGANGGAGPLAGLGNGVGRPTLLELIVGFLATGGGCGLGFVVGGAGFVFTNGWRGLLLITLASRCGPNGPIGTVPLITVASPDWSDDSLLLPPLWSK